MSTIKGVRGKTMAVLVAACMLLCVLSPAIVNWNEEGFFAEDGDEPNFTYVALGDSMVNGFGMADYYPDATKFNYNEVVDGNVVIDNEATHNYYGFLKTPVDAYPTLMKEYLEEELGYIVNEDYMLAVSGMRSTELRSLLYDGFIDDDYNIEDRLGGDSEALDLIYKVYGEKYGIRDMDGLKKYYRDMIAKADLITYNFHYDFGYDLSATMMHFMAGEENGDLSYYLYLDDELIEAKDTIREYVKNMVYDLLEIAEIDKSAMELPLKLVEMLSDTITFVILEYCTNFDKNMEYIFKNNKNGYDADVIVVDAYNTFAGIDVIYGDIRVPLGGLYGLVLDAVNTYTKYISPYSVYITQAEVDGTPLLYGTEIATSESSEDVSLDSKRGAIFATTIWENGASEYPFAFLNMVYDSAPGLNTFLKCVFQSNAMDFGYFTQFENGFDDAIDAISAKAGIAIAAIMANGDVTVTDNGCIVEGYVEVEDEVWELMTVEFDKNELTMIWMNFYLIEAEALMSHPCAEGHSYIFESVKAAYDSVDEENEGWRKIYELYLEGGLPYIEKYLEGIYMDCKADIDEFIATVEGHIDELKNSVLAETAEVLETVKVLQAMVDELKSNVFIAIGKIDAGMGPAEALASIGLEEILSKYAAELEVLALDGSESAGIAYKLITSEKVGLILQNYNYLIETGIDDFEAFVDAAIEQIEFKVQCIILAIEEKIAELALYAESQVPGTLATIAVLEGAVAELEANLASAMDMVGEYPVSVILDEIGLYAVWVETTDALADLADAGADAAKVALVLLNADPVVEVLCAYETAIFTFQSIEMAVARIVEEISTYVDADSEYYAYEDILYVSDSDPSAIFNPDVDLNNIESIIGLVGALIGDLRLMDYAALLTGGEFDGKVDYTEADYDYIKDVVDQLKTSNVVLFEANSGNLIFLLNEILTYEGAEELDFGVYSGLIGEDAAAFLNDIEDLLAPYVEKICEFYPDFAMPADLLEFLAERLAYMALGTFEGMIYTSGVVQGYNELATVMFAGLYNPFAGVDVMYDGEHIPVAEIMDAYVAVFNTVVYELCEEMPGTVYVDVSGMYADAKPFVLDVDKLDKVALIGLIGKFIVNEEYVIAQAEEYLGFMEKLPIYNTVWVDGDGDVLYEVLNQPGGYLDVKDYGYGDDVPGKTETEDYYYVFTGEWSADVEGDTKTYTALFDEEDRKPVVSSDKEDVTIDLEVYLENDNVTDVVVKNDEVTVSIPKSIFAGATTATVSMKFVEQTELPGNLAPFTEGKKVISLELFVDGNKITDFGKNEVSVSVDYDLAPGEDASTLAVWYMDTELMVLEKVDSSFENGVLTITMNHFSYWVIGHEVIEDDSDDEAFPVAVAVMLVIIAALCVVLLRFKE
ncbi:MAG: hypothetical protein IKC93_02885 [Candidatus Methanomethylophilaceae archaeon]|nr:hypothetical protein [Candidatus Methanomethylophilaceae archaeon]